MDYSARVQIRAHVICFQFFHNHLGREAIYLEDVPCRTCDRNPCTQEWNFCILDLPVHRVEDALDRLEFASEPRPASVQPCCTRALSSGRP